MTEYGLVLCSIHWTERVNKLTEAVALLRILRQEALLLLPGWEASPSQGPSPPPLPLTVSRYSFIHLGGE